MKTTTASALRLTKALSGGRRVPRNSSKEWAYRSAWVLTPWLPLTGCVTQASVSLFSTCIQKGCKDLPWKAAEDIIGVRLGK